MATLAFMALDTKVHYPWRPKHNQQGTMNVLDADLADVGLPANEPEHTGFNTKEASNDDDDDNDDKCDDNNNNNQPEKEHSPPPEHATTLASASPETETDLDFLEDPDRRITFVDAAAAIALTLLILPLMDAANEAVDSSIDESLTLGQFFQEYHTKFSNFFFSFFVVASAWGEQAQFFQRLQYLTPLLGRLLWIWLVCVVLMPVVTILASPSIEGFPNFLYIGLIMVFKAINLVIVLLVRVPRRFVLVWKPGHQDVTAQSLITILCDFFLLGVALPLSMTRISLASMLLLLLGRPLTYLWTRYCPMPPDVVVPVETANPSREA